MTHNTQLHSLSIFGTSSDAGKSTLSFALTYLLHKQGIKVAPFKAQNVSNNSVVTDKDTGEIAIPQAFAAEAVGLKTTPLFNPILLKSGGKNSAHIIINGTSIGERDVWNYYRNMEKLHPVVDEALQKLQEEYACIVAEGAGSPVELNLMDKDLSNLYVARKLNSKIIVVADIERGGVFASIYGVFHLLPKDLQGNVIGVVINKFRGDMTLFDTGREIIEKEFGLKVLGVIPYKPFNLGFEDAASLMGYTQDTTLAIMKVAVIKLPHISNFTDFEPLVADREIVVDFISNATELQGYDMIIVPGSKRVVDDLLWLKERGFEPILQDKKRKIVAICGGYEMMFEEIRDPHHIESKHATTKGFGRLKGACVFQKEKILYKGCYNLWGIMAEGYEIHNATAKKRAKKKKNLYATFVHAFFENDALRAKLFREINPAYKGYSFQHYKHKAIADFAHHIEQHLDMKYLMNALDATSKGLA